ncbi:membrane-anchored protein [Brevibacillus choshinensis]|uniref:Membrane-anchored protein n=1 Tax=Brevibacillus choshinensis TaxID=54911 RepID=A0ABR5N6U1_BRECH|nr:DUF2167 domain-containing protein [Brevibacillus choshinensis]KQL46344.1 membrane-anchored protein [Brevibacillus choshinensis]
MSKRSWLSFFTVLMISFGMLLPVAAEQTFNWVKSGTKVELENKFSFTVPEKMVYLNKEDTIKMEQQVGDIPTMREIGSVLPQEEADQWLLYMEYEETGHISDDEQNDIDAEELLQSYKDGTEEANKQRKPEDQFHVVGWNVEPTYDAKTHELEYSMLLESAQKEKFLNYKLQVLTRTGYVSFILVTDQEHLQADKQTLRASILKNFTVKEGHRYSDFDEKTDQVAEYGLTGLILGGLGLAAAKKLGLMALILAFAKKGWILIVVLIGAIAKFGKRLFGKKQTTENIEADEDKPSA